MSLEISRSKIITRVYQSSNNNTIVVDVPHLIAGYILKDAPYTGNINTYDSCHLITPNPYERLLGGFGATDNNIALADTLDRSAFRSPTEHEIACAAASTYETFTLQATGTHNTVYDYRFEGVSIDHEANPSVPHDKVINGSYAAYSGLYRTVRTSDGTPYPYTGNLQILHTWKQIVGTTEYPRSVSETYNFVDGISTRAYGKLENNFAYSFFGYLDNQIVTNYVVAGTATVEIVSPLTITNISGLVCLVVD